MIFKSVFTDLENILAKMISDITGIPYEILENNITLETNELPIKRKNEKAKKCDFIIKISDKNILNLELNRQSYTGYIIKNLTYVFSLFSSYHKKGESYDEDLIVMQINLNCFKEYSKKALSKYYIKEETDGSVYTNNFIIYALNVVNCHKLYYNEPRKEIPNYVKWGALIYCNNMKDIPQITKGIMTYEERNMLMDKLNKLQNDDQIWSEIDAQHWSEWEKNTSYNTGKKEGIQEGIEQGKIDTKKEIIQSMLKNKFDLETISKITNISIEEIKKIKDQ